MSTVPGHLRSSSGGSDIEQGGDDLGMEPERTRPERRTRPGAVAVAGLDDDHSDATRTIIPRWLLHDRLRAANQRGETAGDAHVSRVEPRPLNGLWGNVSKLEVRLVGIVGLLAVIAGVCVVVGVVVPRGEERTPASVPITAPSTSPTARPLTAQQELNVIRGVMHNNIFLQSDAQRLPAHAPFYYGKANDPTAAPEVRAASWIMFDDPVDSQDRTLMRFSLAVLYYSTNGDGWTVKDGWMTEANACEFHGIHCDVDENVVAIALSGNNLVGTIPNVLTILTSLKALHLEDNDLTGSLPIGFCYDSWFLSLGEWP